MGSRNTALVGQKAFLPSPLLPGHFLTLLSFFCQTSCCPWGAPKELYMMIKSREVGARRELGHFYHPLHLQREDTEAQREKMNYPRQHRQEDQNYAQRPDPRSCITQPVS